jgi:hypothetical protein
MGEPEQKDSYPNKIALIGNYLPRQCGIATFTTDLRASLAAENPTGDCWVIAMNDVPQGYRYPGQVRFEINQRILSDYRGVFKILCHGLGLRICPSASVSKSQLQEWAFNLPRRRSWLLLERGYL